MAGSSSGSSLRRSGSARITFFVFLDIITAVTGILILVILLFALRAGNEIGAGNRSGSAAAGTANTGASSLTALETELAERLMVLERLSQENRRRSLELSDAETTADAATLRADITSLQATLTQVRATLPRANGASQARTAATEADARDAAAGLTADRAQIEEARARVTRLTPDNAAKRAENEQRESEVKDAEGRLLAAQAGSEHKLFLIPESPGTTKAPLLMVLSQNSATIERYNLPATRTTLYEDNDASDFRKALRHFKRLDDYIVFYVRPSGIDRFEKYLKEARAAGFDVGYDAVDENRELVFAPRKE